MKKVRHKATVTAGNCIAIAFKPRLSDSRWCTLPCTLGYHAQAYNPRVWLRYSRFLWVI